MKLVSILSLILVSTPAFAQDLREQLVPDDDRITRARAAFHAGSEAFSVGRFGLALDQFTRAYELAPRSELLYNMATAHDRLGHTEAALRTYQDYLQAQPDADNRDYTESRIAVLQRQAREAEHEVEEEVDEPEVEPEPEAGPNIPAIALLAGAGAAALAAVVTGAVALGQRGDLEDQCPMMVCDPARQNDLDRLQRFTLTTDVLVGVAAAAALAGVLLFVLGGEDDDVTVSLGPFGAHLTVPLL